jgi:hypothetical protein
MQANAYSYLPQQFVGINRIYFIVAMVATIIVFLAKCLIYEDNDAKCWYLVIPFYNLYTKFKIFWNKNYFFFHLIPFIIAFISILAAGVVFISVALNQMGGTGYNLSQVAVGALVIMVVGVCIWLLCVTIIGVLEILLEYHLSTTYGYDGLFTIGLLFLPVVFYIVLGVKCLQSGVLRRIPTGRKVFMIVWSMLLVAITVASVYFRVV